MAQDSNNPKRAAMAKIRLVEEILRRWDPIGVAPGTDGPADEYDGYAPRIVTLVQAGCTVEELAAHLDHLAASVMGVGSNEILSLQFSAEIMERLKP